MKIAHFILQNDLAYSKFILIVGKFLVKRNFKKGLSKRG